MKIALVGLGLIGGSFAKAIKANTKYQVDGYDASPEVMLKAIAEGTVDNKVSDYSAYDMIIISLYPAAITDFLASNISSFSKGTIVIDSGGVKQEVCDVARELFKSSEAIFIGGHPMAGREFSGYDYSIAELFCGASMILTPDNVEDHILSTLERFYKTLGFGQVVYTTPEDHDQIIAYTSQLAHVVSSAFMQSPTALEHMGFSAGSFKDLTRVAKLNPEMWSELFLDNSRALLKEIGTIIEHLETFKLLIETKDKARLKSMLQYGSDIKEKLNHKQEKINECQNYTDKCVNSL